MSGLQCLVGGSCQKQGSAASSGFAVDVDYGLAALPVLCLGDNFEFVSIVPVCITLFSRIANWAGNRALTIPN